jgi:hypothetical protein
VCNLGQKTLHLNSIHGLKEGIAKNGHESLSILIVAINLELSLNDVAIYRRALISWIGTAQGDPRRWPPDGEQNHGKDLAADIGWGDVVVTTSAVSVECARVVGRIGKASSFTGESCSLGGESLWFLDVVSSRAQVRDGEDSIGASFHSAANGGIVPSVGGDDTETCTTLFINRPHDRDDRVTTG